MFNINDEVTYGTSPIIYIVLGIRDNFVWLREKDNNLAFRCEDIAYIRKVTNVFDKLKSFTKGLSEIIEIGLTFAFEDSENFNRIFKTITYKNNKPLIVVYANGRNSFTCNGKFEEIPAEYLIRFTAITRPLIRAEIK